MFGLVGPGMTGIDQWSIGSIVDIASLALAIIVAICGMIWALFVWRRTGVKLTFLLGREGSDKLRLYVTNEGRAKAPIRKILFVAGTVASVKEVLRHMNYVDDVFTGDALPFSLDAQDTRSWDLQIADLPPSVLKKSERIPRGPAFGPFGSESGKSNMPETRVKVRALVVYGRSASFSNAIYLLDFELPPAPHAPFEFTITSLRTAPPGFWIPTCVGVDCVVADGQLIIPGAAYDSTIVLRTIGPIYLSDSEEEFFIGIDTGHSFLKLGLSSREERDEIAKRLSQVANVEVIEAH